MSLIQFKAVRNGTDHLDKKDPFTIDLWLDEYPFPDYEQKPVIVTS